MSSQKGWTVAAINTSWKALHWLLALKCAWDICPGYMYVCTLCILCNNTGTDTRSRSKWLLCLFIVPRFQGFPMARCVHFAFPDDVRSTLLCSQSTFCGIFHLVTFERCLFFLKNLTYSHRSILLRLFLNTYAFYLMIFIDFNIQLFVIIGYLLITKEYNQVIIIELR